MKSSNSMVGPVTAVVLGIVCGALAIVVPKMEYIASISFAILGAVLLVTFRDWELGILLALILGAPPYLDYELAWTAPVAIRTSQVGAIRAEITQPILSAFDVWLGVAFLLSLVRQRSCGRLSCKRMPIWFVSAFVFMSLLRVLSSAVAAVAYPELSRTACAGVTSILRSVIATIIVARTVYSRKVVSRVYLPLAVGTILFTVESVYVSYVKYGGLKIGLNQLTGLIPGPGGTGAMMVLVVPLVIAGTFSSRGKSDRMLVVAASAMGATLALFTYSRNVVAGILVAFFVVFAGARTMRLRVPRVLSLALMALAVTASVVAGDWIKSKFASTFMSGIGDRVNLGTRFAIWQTAWQLVRSNWLLGHGTLMWALVTGGFRNAHNAFIQFTNAHNAFIQFTAENGVPAAVVFVALIIASCLHAVSQVRSWHYVGARDLVMSKVGLLAGMMGFVISQVVSSSLGHVRVNLVFSIFLAMLVMPFVVEDPPVA
jgi:O-antigen ligase